MLNLIMKYKLKNRNSQYWWGLYIDALNENIVLEKKIKDLERKIKRLEMELAGRTKDDM